MIVAIKNHMLHLLILPMFIISCGQAQNEQAVNENNTTFNVNVADTSTELVCLPEDVECVMQNMLFNYMELKEALVHENPEVAAEIAHHINYNIANMSLRELEREERRFLQPRINKMRQVASNISQSRNIEEQREAFHQFSQNVYEVLTAFEFNTDPVYIKRCPRAINGQGGMWLSDKEEIENPYFGKGKTECGNIEEVIG